MSKLTELVKQFNQDVVVSIELDSNIKLKLISDASNEIDAAIKKLQCAKNALSKIHSEYTISLEPK